MTCDARLATFAMRELPFVGGHDERVPPFVRFRQDARSGRDGCIVRIGPVGLEIVAHADDFRRFVDVATHKQIRAWNEFDDKCRILDAIRSHVLCAVEHPIAWFDVFLCTDDVGIILAFIVFYGVACHEDKLIFRDEFLYQFITCMVGMLMGVIAAVNEIGQRFQIFSGQVKLITVAVLIGIFPFDAAVDIESEYFSACFHKNA